MEEVMGHRVEILLTVVVVEMVLLEETLQEIIILTTICKIMKTLTDIQEEVHLVVVPLEEILLEELVFLIIEALLLLYLDYIARLYMIEQTILQSNLLGNFTLIENLNQR